MKKIVLFLFSLPILLINLNAQIETFDLADFKLPNIRVDRLDADFLFNTQDYHRTWVDTSGFQYTNARVNPRLRFGGVYNLYINSPTEQSEYYISTNLGLNPINNSFTELKDELTAKTRIKSFDFDLFASSRNRFYLQDQVFIEIGPSVSFKYSLERRKSISENTIPGTKAENIRKTGRPNISTALDIGAGFGRLEIVSDAQRALYILQDLREENRLVREPDHQEIYELAELISHKRTQRFFDGRHRIIDQIKALDSILTAMELINDADVTYFTTLYDTWLYANNPLRMSGFRVSGGPLIQHQLSAINQTTKFIEPDMEDSESKQKFSSFSYGGWVQIRDEKPINLYWQRSLSASFSYVWRGNRETTADDERLQRNSDQYDLRLFAGYGYYPNTRTFINFGIGAGWYKQNQERYFYPVETDYNEEDYFVERIYAGPTANGYYYFSPRLRFSFNASLDYNFRKINDPSWTGELPIGIRNRFGSFDNNRFSFNVNAGFNYAVF